MNAPPPYASQEALADAHRRLVKLCQTRAFSEAVSLAEDIVTVHPKQPAIWLLLGCALTELDRLEAAEDALQRAAALAPNEVATQFNYAVVLQRQNKLMDAAKCYQTALHLSPKHIKALNNLGTTLRDLGRPDDAIEAIEKALTIAPDYHDARVNLAGIFERQKDLSKAIHHSAHVLRARPDHKPARALMTRLKRVTCDFNADAGSDSEVATIGLDGTSVPPFLPLAIEDAPERQQQRAKAWVAKNYGHIQPAQVASTPKKRLRIGYFSCQFREHPIMVLASGLFRAHDLTQHEVFAFSTRAFAHDAYTSHVKTNTSGFFDMSAQSDAQVAEFAREQALDVAIDIDGHTRGARLGILAHRVALIQISYLGYPGTSSAPFLDYLVADEVLIPTEQRRHYDEAVIYMPGSYQATDDKRIIPSTHDSRSDHGLPENAFVLCCFNASFKIGTDEFDIWMRVLHAAEDAVLWLYRSNDQMVEHLRSAARKCGIDPERIVFANRLPHGAHLARHRHADLFVDTFNYNAHTTASDALWAGLPVVTKAGQQFSARVGASLLRAFGLSELITETPEAYEALILDLMSDRARSATLKAEVAALRATAPLFATDDFARHLEKALRAVHERAVAGLDPQDLRVASL